ncbi:cation diffusion facilitator family transporter [Candidatus Formimonas warabiya]|uniref:Uncharacterized protein n=1 Tax=Formimonas warabiya TaxID=1761012 RepID=A0A3G1KZK2_FORW1|nr:cation diffusion facilitator family transporter [Candidatus Formimonas warabiya]ATW27837.1 hypothetical protein DCMF_26545 [Candidatus Formimonas warabiya]
MEQNDEVQKQQDLSDQKADTAKYGFILGLLINGTALFAAVLANSLVAVSDIINGLTETLSIFLTWLAMKRVAKGNVHQYNYGQGKMENLASLGIVLALLFSFTLICINAVARLQHPSMVNLSGVMLYLVMALIALATNVFFWFRAYHLATIASSPGIEAQWRLFRVKAISNAFVFVSLGLNVVFHSYSWVGYLDPAFSLVVASMILVSAYKIFTKSIYDLLDGALEENVQLIIMRELAAHFDEYQDFHGVRSRRVGSRVFIELFLQFDPERTMREVQDSIDTIRRSMEKSIKSSQVIIMPSTSRIA